MLTPEQASQSMRYFFHLWLFKSIQYFMELQSWDMKFFSGRRLLNQLKEKKLLVNAHFPTKSEWH